MSDLRITEIPEDKLVLMRTHFLNTVGVYASDEEVIKWAIDNGYHTETQKQVGGNHYQMPIQPIEYIVKNDIPYREANVIKYVSRHKNKNGKEDILKAIHYLEMILEDYTNE